MIAQRGWVTDVARLDVAGAGALVGRLRDLAPSRVGIANRETGKQAREHRGDRPRPGLRRELEKENRC